jgi:biotin carboxyl carrier protein
MSFIVNVDSVEYKVNLDRQGNTFNGTINGKQVSVEVVQAEGDHLALILDNTPYSVVFGDDGSVTVNDETYTTSVFDEQMQRIMKATPVQLHKREIVIKAPMPGLIVEIMVREGTNVKSGKGLLVVEAMKMQNEMSAPIDGVVKKILVKQGQTVNSGDALIVIE